MKKMKKILSGMLACVMLIGALAGCGNNQPGNQGGNIFGDDPNNNVAIDSNKIQLYVTTFAGGLGDSWLVEVAKRFNAQSDKYQVVVGESLKDDYPSIEADIMAGTSEYDIYFNVFNTYESLAAGGYLETLDDILEMKPDGDSGKSVRDKMMNAEDYTEFYTYKGNLYALPFTELWYGMHIDYSLFEEMGWLCTNPDGSFTLGVDGQPNTYDDGWPVNMTEFDAMLQRITASGYTPFNFPGKYTDYLICFLEAIWAMYDGVDNYRLSYTYDGTYEPTNGSGFTITPQSGDQTNDMQGKLKALEFFEKYFGNMSNVTSYSKDLLVNHTDAQKYFIQQVVASKNYEKCAIHLDGEWWEHEAKSQFDLMEKSGYTDYAYETRDYRMMPIPSFDGSYGLDGQGGGSVAAVHEFGNCFIKKQSNPEKTAGAKAFLVYTLSDEMLSYFVAETGSVRPYVFNLLEEYSDDLSTHNKSVLAMKNNPDVFQACNRHVFAGEDGLRSADVIISISRWSSKLTNGVVYSDPFLAMKENPGLTAKEYLKGIQSANQNAWDRAKEQLS